MKIQKLLMLMLVSLFLVSSVSAVSFYAEWQDNTTDISIMNGQNVGFAFDAYTASPPMVLNVKLYNSSMDLVKSFVNNFEYNGLVYSGAYSITPSMYNNQYGDYTLVISGSDENDAGSSYVLDLEVQQLPDTQNPVVVINTPVEGNTYNNQVNTITYTITDNRALSNCWVSTNNGVTTTAISCTSGSYTGLTSVQGSNTWTVYASDTSNNFVTETVTFNVNQDLIAPVIAVVSPVDGTTYSNSNLLFQISTNEVAEAKFILDNGAEVSMNTADGLSHGYQVTLAVGNHNVVFSATDTSGNVATTTVNFVISSTAIDNVAPVVTITYPDNDTEYSSDRTIIFYTVYDINLDSCWYSLNGGQTNYTLTTCGGAIRDIRSDEGENTWTIYAIDTSGNLGMASVTFEVNTDDDDDDDDTDRRNLRTIYTYSDEFNDYLNQFNETHGVIDLMDDDSEYQKASFFSRLWNLIKRFFGF